MIFVAEILHRLEIEKRIDGPGAGLLVAGVHFAAEAQAPFGDHQGEPDVRPDGDEGHQGEPKIIERPQDGADNQDLDNGGNDGKQHEGQGELYPLGAALDGARQAAGLAVEMEA